MRLYEIPEGEPIQILSSNEDISMQYNTEVRHVVNEIVLVDPIHHEGSVINYESEIVKNDVIYIQNGEKPIIWENCLIKLLEYQGDKLYAIYSKRESKRLNRRTAYRQYIGCRGTLICEKDNKKCEVTVKDISTGGVSFVASPELTKEDVGKFQLMYEDADSKVSVQLSGFVIREELVDESKKVFGCRLRRANVELNSYIAAKQKKEIAKRNGNDK